MTWCRGLLLAVVVLAVGCARAPVIADGTYYGYEFMENLTPEQPNAVWYHENIMTINGPTVRIEKYPRTQVGDEVMFSASDGGFFTLEGSIEVIAGRTLVGLRLVKCEYCRVAVDDPLPSKRLREYVVAHEKDGSLEIDHVRYRREPDPKLHGRPGA